MPIDSFSQDGTRELCRRINAYWRERGYDANAVPVHHFFPSRGLNVKGDPGGMHLWIIVSDLVGMTARAAPSPFRSPKKASRR